MNYTELRKTVFSSSIADWHDIPTWGFGLGPNFNYVFMEGNGEPKTHSNIMIYKPDLNISLQYGMPVDTAYNWNFSNYNKEWVGADVEKCFVDIFWSGHLIERFYYAIVDNVNGIIPLSELSSGSNGQKVSKFGYKLMRLISSNMGIEEDNFIMHLHAGKISEANDE